MSKWERTALEHFQTPAERPAGLPRNVLFNLVSHKWIIRTEREEDYGPETYVITQAGRNALRDDLEKQATSN